MAAIDSDSKYNVFELASRFIVSATVDLDKAAGDITFAALDRNMKGVLRRTTKADNIRQVIFKMRGLIETLLDLYAFEEEHAKRKAEGYKRWMSLPEQQFNKMRDKAKKVKADFRYRPLELIGLQTALSEAETFMNNNSIQDVIALNSYIGKFVDDLRKRDGAAE